MAYPEKLLADGEHVEFQMRPHWRAIIPPMIWLFAVLVGGFFLLGWWGSHPDWPVAGSWVIGIAMLVLFIGWTARPFAYWWTTDYVFTNRRIIVRTGLVARKGRDMPLSKVNNVSFDVSFWGRLLNYGVLTIDSASDQPLVIADVPNVEVIQMDINRLHEEDDVRRRRELGPLPDDGV